MDELGWSRRKAALLMGVAVTLVGIVPAMSLDALGLMDKIVGEMLLLVGGLALVPIGGNFTMDPADAAWAVKELIKPKAVIPMHYGINPLAKGTAKEFVEAMGSGPITVIVAVPGQALNF